MQVNGKEVDLKQFAELCASIGARSAMDHLEKIKSEKMKNKENKRLRNTEILLKNYRSFAVHKDAAIYSRKAALEIINDIDEYEIDECYVESIKKSAQRTGIIVAHMEKMIEEYRRQCKNNYDTKPEMTRRYYIITGLYIDELEKAADIICSDLHINQRTFYRDRKVAVKEIKSLMFGVDSL